MSVILGVDFEVNKRHPRHLLVTTEIDLGPTALHVPQCNASCSYIDLLQGVYAQDLEASKVTAKHNRLRLKTYSNSSIDIDR